MCENITNFYDKLKKEMSDLVKYTFYFFFGFPWNKIFI